MQEDTAANEAARAREAVWTGTGLASGYTLFRSAVLAQPSTVSSPSAFLFQLFVDSLVC